MFTGDFYVPFSFIALYCTKWLFTSVSCLLSFWWEQEFWVGNEELVRMYLERLNNAGYTTFKLARTNNRGDGTFLCLNLH